MRRRSNGAIGDPGHKRLTNRRIRPAHPEPTKGRGDEPPPFHRLVYRLVSRVPQGKVVTYGQVAAMLGRPHHARAVGMALGVLRGPPLDAVPWQRVVSATGRCIDRGGFWADAQRELLEEEGVRFNQRGEVDLAHARWRARSSGQAHYR